MDALEPTPEPHGPPPLPSIPRRLVDVFLAPDRLARALAGHPAWAGALVFGALLVALQVWLIPLEVWEATFRQTMIERGQDPSSMAMGGALMRVSGMVAGSVFWVVLAFALSGIITGVFVFVLGDEGRYVQYLSALSHAWLIPALVGLALVPLRIVQADPQLTLNLGTFFFFLPNGYILRVLTFLDLTQLWALLVVAEGAHAIDPRRSFASAAGILLALNLALALALAPFIPG